ncbi:hypothetical protein [Deinococcus hohokamensis]|uniref:Uncharacterized protein n=1 Tax=Deinococcus hohokamensis TaxID=309883 RepID=A0ABV9ID24_9DEIO
MDLESWTPKDKARRLAVLAAVYIAMILMVVSVLALNWPWYVAPLVGLVSYWLAFSSAYAAFRSLFRR